MSRRANLYRRKYGGMVRGDIITALHRQHQHAIGKKSGKVCSLPMREEKVQGLADNIMGKKR